MPKEVFQARYSGSLRSGVCLCGHGWETHHLGMVMNEDYAHQTHEIYVPQECEYYGSNEMGGHGSDGREHCAYYRDSKED
jgi:hypothetical protein